MNTHQLVVGTAAFLLGLSASLAQVDDISVFEPRETGDVSTPTGDAAMGSAGPRGLITQEVYRERRMRLLEHMRENGYSAAVIFNDPRDSPSGGPDRSGLEFYYFTGIEHEAGAALLLDPEAEKHAESLYLPMHDAEDHVWHGERPTLGRGLELTTGFASVRRMASLPGALASAILTGESNQAVFLGPVVGYNRPMLRQLEVLRDATARIPGASVAMDREIVPAMRQAKDELEVELVSRAIANTSEGLRRAMREIEPGMTEFELRTIIETAFHE